VNTPGRVVWVGAMFAALLQRHVAARLGAGVARSIGEDLLGYSHPESTTRIGRVASPREREIEEGFWLGNNFDNAS
jgi:hypothetical protein